MRTYGYSYNKDTRELTVYEDNQVLSVLSDVEDKEEDWERLTNEEILYLRDIEF